MKIHIPTVLFFSVIGILLLTGTAYLYQSSQNAFFAKPSSSSSSASPSAQLLQGKYNCKLSPATDVTTTAYIDNGNIRADSIVGKDKQPINVLVKNETLYIWNPDTKKGNTKKYPGVMNIISQLITPYEKSCKKTDIFPENIFTIPQDIVFSEASSNNPQTIIQNNLK